MKPLIFNFIFLVSVVFAMKSEAAVAKAEKIEKADLSVMGFQTWKASRIDDARSAVDRLSDQDRESATPTPKAARRGKQEIGSRLQIASKNGRPDQRLQQAQINLEMAQELTVNDYFVLYLSQFKQKEAFVEAAKKLSPEEAADLMMSYQKRLSSGDADVSPNPTLGSALFGGSRLK